MQWTYQMQESHCFERFCIWAPRFLCTTQFTYMYLYCSGSEPGEHRAGRQFVLWGRRRGDWRAASSGHSRHRPPARNQTRRQTRNSQGSKKKPNSGPKLLLWLQDILVDGAGLWKELFCQVHPNLADKRWGTRHWSFVENVSCVSPCVICLDERRGNGWR